MEDQDFDQVATKGTKPTYQIGTPSQMATQVTNSTNMSPIDNRSHKSAKMANQQYAEADNVIDLVD